MLIMAPVERSPDQSPLPARPAPARELLQVPRLPAVAQSAPPAAARSRLAQRRDMSDFDPTMAPTYMDMRDELLADTSPFRVGIVDEGLLKDASSGSTNDSHRRFSVSAKRANQHGAAAQTATRADGHTTVAFASDRALRRSAARTRRPRRAQWATVLVPALARSRCCRRAAPPDAPNRRAHGASRSLRTPTLLSAQRIASSSSWAMRRRLRPKLHGARRTTRY